MNSPITTEALLAAVAELQRDEDGNWPGTHPSPSQRRQNRYLLMNEREIVWLLPEPEAKRLRWARERFGKPLRRERGMIAKSIDGRGRAVRYWTARPNDLETYAAMLKRGNCTCPIEAIWPPSIEAGQPAMPAHPFLAPELWANIAAAEGTPIELPAEAPDDVANAGQIMRSFWQGLAPDSLP
jgi:hypothetical protein